MQVIKDGQIQEDDWQLCSNETLEELPASGDIIVPLSLWKEHGSELMLRDGRVGVCIHGDEDPSQLLEQLDRLDLIALDFPVFRDGRSYSNARLLRDRYGFRGELRAVGDVLRDQIFYMRRCGIDSFQIREDKNSTDAIKGLSDFSVSYQAASDGVLPVYKHRNQ